MARNRSTDLTVILLGVLAAFAAVWLLGARAPGATPAAAATPSATADDRARDGVLVSGTGKVMGRPDTLTAEFGAESSAATVDGALGHADRALGRIRAALLRGGVDREDLQTAGIEIYPRYDDNGERITGYQAQQRLTVTFRDLDRAGDLIGRAVSAGGDAARLSGLSFGIEDDSSLLGDARRQAFADAKAKAELYGEQSGRGLGRVVSVTETVQGADRPVDQGEYYRAADAAKSVALEPGQQQLSVTVTVEWAFS